MQWKILTFMFPFLIYVALFNCENLGFCIFPLKVCLKILNQILNFVLQIQMKCHMGYKIKIPSNFEFLDTYSILYFQSGIRYLHSSEENKPVMIHRRISVEKVLLDEQFNPLIADSGLAKLLADDVVFSTIKISAAMGYLAPEYVTTGLFTEKSDIYAFGVIILQILSGKQMLYSKSMRLAAACCMYDDFVDTSLQGNFSESEAAKLAKIALACTDELPDHRPAMKEVIQELNRSNAGS